jgi:hypothetical protein
LARNTAGDASAILLRKRCSANVAVCDYEEVQRRIYKEKIRAKKKSVAAV